MLHPISDIRFSKISADIASTRFLFCFQNCNKKKKKLQDPKEFLAEQISSLDKSDSNSLVCFILASESYLQLAQLAWIALLTVRQLYLFLRMYGIV